MRRDIGFCCYREDTFLDLTESEFAGWTHSCDAYDAYSLAYSLEGAFLAAGETAFP